MQRMALLAVLCGAMGCGRQLVGVAKPEALLDWTPQPDDASARITAVKTSAERTYVGFSDGEMFFQANGAAGWDVYDTGPPGGCAQPVPKGPITAFAITYGTTFAAYAGTPGAHGIWRSPEDRPCWGQALISDDFLSLSVSPFSAVELLALGEGVRWVSEDLGGDWSRQPPHSLNFDGDAWVMAAGTGPTGAPRAWLGDGAGHLYESDDLGTAASPDQISWQPVSDPGFPDRPVVAISISPDRPQTLWVTFFGLSADSIWTSDDAGDSWRNPHGGELPDMAAPIGDGGAISGPAASFAGVSFVPGLDVVLLTALVVDSTGTLTSRSFWNAGGSDAWWGM